MNSNLILSLIGKKAEAGGAKKIASSLGKSGQQHSSSFLSILRARLGKVGALPEKRPGPVSCSGRDVSVRGKTSIPRQTSKQSSGEANLGIGLVPMTNGTIPSGRRLQPESRRALVIKEHSEGKSRSLCGQKAKARGIHSRPTSGARQMLLPRAPNVPSASTHRLLSLHARSDVSNNPDIPSRLKPASAGRPRPAVISRSGVRKAPHKFFSRSTARRASLTRRDYSPRPRNGGFTALGEGVRVAEVRTTQHAANRMIGRTSKLAERGNEQVRRLTDQRLGAPSEISAPRLGLTDQNPHGAAGKGSSAKRGTRLVSTASAKTSIRRRMSPLRGVRALSLKAPLKSSASVVRGSTTLTAKAEAKAPLLRESLFNTASQPHPKEGRDTHHIPAGRAGASTTRPESHSPGDSYHSRNKTHRQASVGIWRQVLTNKGHTQPHSRPSQSRQNSYFPAKTNAARRWLPSKASRFWGRSESHHPSFRALGHPQRGDSKTSGLESSGRIPSLSKALRATFELVPTRPKGKTGQKGQRPTANHKPLTTNRPSPRVEAGRRGKLDGSVDRLKAPSDRLARVSTGTNRSRTPAKLTRVARTTIATNPSLREAPGMRRQKSLDTGRGAGVRSIMAKSKSHQPIAGDERPVEVKGNRPSQGHATPHQRGQKSDTTGLKAKAAAAMRPTTTLKAGGTVRSSKPIASKSKAAIAAKHQSPARQSPRPMLHEKPRSMNGKKSFTTHRGQETPKSPDAVMPGRKGNNEGPAESRVKARLHTPNFKRATRLSASSKSTGRAPRVSSREVGKQLSAPRQRSGAASLRSTKTAGKLNVRQGRQPAIPNSDSRHRTQTTASRHGSQEPASVKSPATEEALLSKPRMDDFPNTREHVEGTKVASRHTPPSKPAENAQRQDASRQLRDAEVSKFDSGMSSRQDSSLAKTSVKSLDRTDERAARATDATVKKEVTSSLTKAPDTKAEGRAIPSDKTSANVAARSDGSDNAGNPSNKRQPNVVRSPATSSKTGGEHETSARADSAPKAEQIARPVDDAPDRPSRTNVQTGMAPHRDSTATQSGGKATQPAERFEDISNQHLGKEEALNVSDRKHRDPVRAQDEPPRWTRAENEASKKTVDVAARPSEPAQSKGSAGVVNTKAASGQLESQGLRDAQAVDTGIESDAKPSSAQRSQEMFQGVPAEILTDDSAPGGFRTILAAPRAMTAQVAARIRRLHQSGKQEMRIRLNPPELGAMRIRIRVANNGVKAMLMVDQPQAHTLLEESLPALLRALHDQGLKVDSLSVEIGHGSDEFELSSQSDGQTGEHERGDVRSDHPWREAIDETMLPPLAELSGSRLLDVVA